jgi:hypothetical protein
MESPDGQTLERQGWGGVMARRREHEATHEASDFESALEAMPAEELRAFIRDQLSGLDETAHARFVSALVDRAARGAAGGWAPQGPTETIVREIEHFAQAARRVGYAEPSEVDTYLCEGSNAFLARGYETAARIFRALLIPVGAGDVDLGEHELVSEVLGVDVAACAAQYAVSVYMITSPQRRGQAVLAVIDDLRGIRDFWKPLEELERAAVEPLPAFGDFLAQWRALLEKRTAGACDREWDSEDDRWLRQVVLRIEGPEGLAQVARASRRADDLRAWCKAVAEVGDWKATLVAYDEATGLTPDGADVRGALLDGAALAAHQLGRKDLPLRLERAWREAPTLVRLRRWLGASRSRKTLRERVTKALETCPATAHRQRGLLHLLDGDIVTAARLLAAAPGLGWSDSEHPGHLLFPLLARLVGAVDVPEVLDRDDIARWIDDDLDEARLETPEVAALVALAGISSPGHPPARAAVIEALRLTAEQRIAGVTGKQRRRYYAHAASLALACAQVGPKPEAAAWLAALRARFRRYPALQRELDQRVRS